MKKLTFIIVALTVLCSCFGVKAGEPAKQQWSTEKANQWYAQQVWPVGCCYVPSYATNQFEMWQEETFNLQVLDKEFAICQELGFNLVRIYLHEKLWFADAEGFKSRINQLLELADSYELKVTFTFCTNGGDEQELGVQPESIPGTHGGRWCWSPSTEMMNNPSLWPQFKAYLQDILTSYGNDSRILYWCLQNEPENIKKGRDPYEWMKAMYEWAWEVRPSQPLTSPIWIRPGYKGATTKLDMVAWVVSNSDIISFHCYYSPEELETFIKMLKRFNRPMICQEYLARTLGSTFEGSLPIFKREKIGCLNWGLVEGKAKYRYPWGHKLEDGEPKVWFHSIFWEDYTPWKQSEVDFIKSMTEDKSK